MERLTCDELKKYLKPPYACRSVPQKRNEVKAVYRTKKCRKGEECECGGRPCLIGYYKGRSKSHAGARPDDFPLEYEKLEMLGLLDERVLCASDEGLILRDMGTSLEAVCIERTTGFLLREYVAVLGCGRDLAPIHDRIPKWHHFDLKPANITVSVKTNGEIQEGSARVIDFESCGETPKLSTPFFVPQIHPPYDAYTLGVTLFLMIKTDVEVEKDENRSVGQQTWKEWVNSKGTGVVPLPFAEQLKESQYAGVDDARQKQFIIRKLLEARDDTTIIYDLPRVFDCVRFEGGVLRVTEPPLEFTKKLQERCEELLHALDVYDISKIQWEVTSAVEKGVLGRTMFKDILARVKLKIEGAVVEVVNKQAGAVKVVCDEAMQGVFWKCTGVAESVKFENFSLETVGKSFLAHCRVRSVVGLNELLKNVKVVGNAFLMRSHVADISLSLPCIEEVKDQFLANISAQNISVEFGPYLVSIGSGAAACVATLKRLTLDFQEPAQIGERLATESPELESFTITSAKGPRSSTSLIHAFHVRSGRQQQPSFHNTYFTPAVEKELFTQFQKETCSNPLVRQQQHGATGAVDKPPRWKKFCCF